MSKFLKWVGVILGWSFGGPIGAFLGYAFGHALSGSSKRYINEIRSESSSTQAGNFQICLLVLSSVVIKADGKVQQRELDYVRNYFIRVYGENRANKLFRLFKEVSNNQNISEQQVCAKINRFMNYSSRLELIHFLFGVAGSDGYTSKIEVDKIETISVYLNINREDFISIKSMFYRDEMADYKILKIQKTATDSEVKKAYKKMAIKYHPDKVQNLGQEHLKIAKDKFNKVQQAYENIKKERGFS